MKSQFAPSRLRPITLTMGRPLLTTCIHPALFATLPRRLSYTSSSSTKRRTVTPLNDDGHLPWSDLTAAEKTGRAVQQTVNLSLVLVGLALTSGVIYVLYSEVFSTDSKTTHFNRAVDRIKSDPRCVELLGDGKKLKAFGEETHNSWRRARPIAYDI